MQILDNIFAKRLQQIRNYCGTCASKSFLGIIFLTTLNCICKLVKYWYACYYEASKSYYLIVTIALLFFREPKKTRSWEKNLSSLILYFGTKGCSHLAIIMPIPKSHAIQVWFVSSEMWEHLKRHYSDIMSAESE